MGETCHQPALFQDNLDIFLEVETKLGKLSFIFQDADIKRNN